MEAKFKRVFFHRILLYVVTAFATLRIAHSIYEIIPKGITIAGAAFVRFNGILDLTAMHDADVICQPISHSQSLHHKT